MRTLIENFDLTFAVLTSTRYIFVVGMQKEYLQRKFNKIRTLSVMQPLRSRVRSDPSHYLTGTGESHE